MEDGFYSKGYIILAKFAPQTKSNGGNLRWRRPKKDGSRMAFRRKERAQWQRADPDTPETTASRKRTSTSSSTGILTAASTPRESAVAEIRTTPPARPGAACLTMTDGNIIAGLHVKFNYPSRPALWSSQELQGSTRDGLQLLESQGRWETDSESAHPLQLNKYKEDALCLFLRES